MTPRRKLRQSLLLCVIALALGAYDRLADTDEPSVVVQPTTERLAVAPGSHGVQSPAMGSTNDEVDHQAEEILAF